MFQWLTDQRVLEYYEGRDVKFTMPTKDKLRRELNLEEFEKKE